MADGFILAFFTLILAGLTTSRVLQNTGVIISSCDPLKSRHEFSNFSVGPIIPSDDHLDICVNNGTTCCSRLMEKQLHILNQINVRNIQMAKTDLIRTIFRDGVIKFKDFFEDHIDSSERELDREFTRLYKNAYANNSDVTRSFYTKLRQHYRTGEFKTYEIVNEFFKEVFKKMYVLLNGAKASNIDLDCVASTYEKFEPFGKVPRQLIPRLERSIAAARTMVYGLLSGKDVVEKLSDDKWFSQKCLQSITKISHCSVCSAHIDLKPCAGHCIDAHRECLSSLLEMEDVWDEYLISLMSLGDQLDASFDFEAVTGELPYDISSGIMNCQDALPKLIPKIKKHCKKGKTRRSVVPSDNDFFLDVKLERSFETSRRRPRYTLGRLIRQYQRHFRKLKKFWKKLPNAMCDETVVANNATNYCWDGSTIVNNTASVQQGKINGTSTNGQNDITITSLVSQLQSTIKSIKAAIAGKTIDAPNISDQDWEFSGSGSGSGSGDDEGDDDDDATLTNQIPDGKIELSKPSDDNSVDTNEVLIVKPPDVMSSETGNGVERYLPTPLLLVVTTLLVQFW